MGKNQIAFIVNVKRVPVAAPEPGGIHPNKPANLQLVLDLIIDGICVAAMSHSVVDVGMCSIFLWGDQKRGYGRLLHKTGRNVYTPLSASLLA